LELPPVLHGSPEAGGHGRARRALPPPRRARRPQLSLAGRRNSRAPGLFSRGMVNRLAIAAVLVAGALAAPSTAAGTGAPGSTPGRKAGVRRYQVRVANTGFAPASAVALRLLVDGAVVDTATVASLQPGERRWLSILGPECTRSVEAIVDPDGVIVESSESD